MPQNMQETTRVAAYGLVLNDSKLLLCRFSAMVPELQGQWTLPGGGVEFGEDPVDAVVREVREETGLLVRSPLLAGVDSRTHHSEQVLLHHIRILYHADYVSGTLAYETDGSTDRCAWFSLEEVRALSRVDLVDLGVGYAFA